VVNDDQCVAVAREVHKGARVIQVKAGRTLRFKLAWKYNNEFLDSSDYTCHLYIRDLHNTQKVLLTTEESLALDAILARGLDDDNNEWFFVVLGRSYTRWLPQDCLLEVELIRTDNPEDSVELLSVILKVDPEGVMVP
jgi:hypothetical protein